MLLEPVEWVHLAPSAGEAEIVPRIELHQEQEQLYLRSGVVTSATFEQPGRQVKLWVKMVTPLIKNFF